MTDVCREVLVRNSDHEEGLRLVRMFNLNMKLRTMKRNLQTVAVAALIATGFLIGCSSSKDVTDRSAAGRPSNVQVQEGYDTFGRKWETISRNESIVLHYTGTITDIDYSSRELTLKDPAGQSETFCVDKKVKRFNEAKVGDKVSLDYYLGFDAEVRPPTNEEKANPLVVVDATSKAGPNSAPAAYDRRHVRAVVTIASMDKKAETVTVVGPRGKYYTARVNDPSRLDKVRIGDSILMTFTEATAISLKPAGK